MKVKPASTPGQVVLEMGDKDEPLLANPFAANDIARAFRLQKILVPTDFSDCSRKALQYAVPLARQFGATLVLLNVVSVNYAYGDFAGGDYPLMESELREGAGKQMEQLGETQVGDTIPWVAQVRMGHAVKEILEAAKSMDVDLIIISTHGHTGLKHVLLGSVTEEVVRRAPCPVLTVREHEHDFIVT